VNKYCSTRPSTYRTANMAESLNVIALISGGKDSFFSILHCMRNGHKVVALANLYPEVLAPRLSADAAAAQEWEGEQDLNSFMFQTVGHTVIPLYEQALGIPVYRQPIFGSAIQTGTSYSHAHISQASSSEVGDEASQDETESIVPLLKRIMAEHPSANALSTGAILSTYQRTRVESVALRLGLTPLSYLWKYPILPPGTQTSLLEDMQAVGMDARIVKVASGGLDESFLWENVASGRVVRRIERAMGRFGGDGDGAVLGEGGEFETLVIDGPICLFKERIEVQDGDWRVVREGGGSAWLRVLDAKSVVKAPETTQADCRIPELLEQRFQDMLGVLKLENLPGGLEGLARPQLIPPYGLPSIPEVRHEDLLYWTVTAKEHSQTISDEAGGIITALRRRLSQESLQPSDIISSTIVLRSMGDFQAVNQARFNSHHLILTSNTPRSTVPSLPTPILPRE
jgi:diphthine-ammonia ligase